MQSRAFNLVILTSIYSGFSFAAGPIPFGDWVVNNGVVNTSQSCNNAAVTCKTLAEDAGFIYEEVQTTDYTYLRVVLTDPDSDGSSASVNFSSEVFIPYADESSGTKQGIAAHQVLRDPNDGYELTADIQKANMRQENVTLAEDMYAARIQQTISHADFSSNFETRTYTQFATSPDAGTPDTSTIIGRKTDLDQTIKVDQDKEQQLVVRQREGYQGTTATFFADGFYLVKEAITTGGTATLNGADVSWIAGEKISTSWVAQHNNVPGENAVAISKQTFENMTTQVSASDALFNVNAPVDPFAWDVDLGIQPSFQ